MKKIYISRRKTENIGDLRLTYCNIIMEYQIIINLLDYTTNQAPKFRARNWV